MYLLKKHLIGFSYINDKIIIVKSVNIDFKQNPILTCISIKKYPKFTNTNRWVNAHWKARDRYGWMLMYFLYEVDWIFTHAARVNEWKRQQR